MEEELRIRPSHGFVVCGDGTRHRIENTQELRSWVLDWSADSGRPEGGDGADPGSIPRLANAARAVSVRIAAKFAFDVSYVARKSRYPCRVPL